MSSYSSLVKHFNKTLGTEFQPSCQVEQEARRFIQFAASSEALSSAAMRSALIADINAKFRFNAAGVKAFLGVCAKQKVVFNYHEKNDIAKAFDSSDADRISELLRVKRALDAKKCSELASAVEFVDESKTLRLLHSELISPTLTRKDSKPRDWSQEILEGLFCAYVCRAFGSRVLHAFNSGAAISSEYESDYWTYLKRFAPELHSTKPSFILVDASAFTRREHVLKRVAEAYQQLPKFGYAAIWIDPKKCRALGNEWDLYTDIVLYAEKHLKRTPSNSFFRSGEIERVTAEYIPSLDVGAADFRVWNDGFYYQDCFLVGEVDTRLLVLLQKSEADETPVPCPGCRSTNVQGNSYSSLGVKSWECCNILCPDKSKFGRGKRYSFVQLLKQAAIEEPGNDIPAESVKKWLRDIQPERTEADVVEMLARHYTLAGDTLLVDGFPVEEGAFQGRNIVKTIRQKVGVPSSVIEVKDFPSASFFSRYDVSDGLGVSGRNRAPDATDGLLSAFHGEAGEVLRGVATSSIDGAVTSPPYYNAREYSQWENIYTYLYDMRRINEQVYRVLKPGAYYLYNIFDYFDNENSVVFSAMGEKRLILGAYTADLFRRIGFDLVGNVAWDKGDIEGKRGFNGGNFSPYYQAPFNCWEHILVFRKPGAQIEEMQFPSVLRQGAVIKMVRGENTHGHTAPYPEAIPALLAERLPALSTILDPFGGSMTTGIAAARHGCRCICIEQDREYFDLGLSRFRGRVEQLELV